MTAEPPDLKQIEKEAEGLLKQCDTPQELEDARVRLLGRKGLVTGVMGIAGFFIPAVMNIENGRHKDEGTETDSPLLAVNPVEVD